jgi:ankyrin repeat protein
MQGQAEALMTEVHVAVYVLRQDGKSALLWASEKGHVEIVKLLLGAKADVHGQDKVRTCVQTVLQHVSMYECCLRWLTLQPDLQNGYSALMRASENNHVEIAKLLIAAGSDKDIVNKVSFGSQMSVSQVTLSTPS